MCPSCATSYRYVVCTNCNASVFYVMHISGCSIRQAAKTNGSSSRDNDIATAAMIYNEHKINKMPNKPNEIEMIFINLCEHPIEKIMMCMIVLYCKELPMSRHVVFESGKDDYNQPVNERNRNNI